MFCSPYQVDVRIVNRSLDVLDTRRPVTGTAQNLQNITVFKLLNDINSTVLELQLINTVIRAQHIFQYRAQFNVSQKTINAVSYTHLTLPTILRV